MIGGTRVVRLVAARTQSTAEKSYRAGYPALLAGEEATYPTPLSQRLRELGYTEGRNLTIEYRWAAGWPERLGQVASHPSRVAADSAVRGRPGCQR